MNVEIRKGKKEDLKEVLSLIKELAIYEKASAEVELTISELEKDGFGERPLFSFFVAEVNLEVVGLALFYIKYSTWKGKCIYLEDLIVSQTHRRRGIGKLLFDAVAQNAHKFGAKRMEWQVLDWNHPAIEFYKKHYASLDDEWINCRLTEEQLKAYQ